MDKERCGRRMRSSSSQSNIDYHCDMAMRYMYVRRNIIYIYIRHNKNDSNYSTTRPHYQRSLIKFLCQTTKFLA